MTTPLVNFNNSRFINNCSSLCYNNASIHFLYSIVEFREMVYNIDKITNSNTSYKRQDPPFEINKLLDGLLFRLKFIFFLLNKTLIDNGEQFIINDHKIECNRSQGSIDSFYNFLYYPLIKYTTVLSYNNIEGLFFTDPTFVDMDSESKTDAEQCSEIKELDTKIFSRVSLIFYLNVFSDISDKLFCYYIADNFSKVFIHTDLELSYTKETFLEKKYLIYKPDGKKVDPSFTQFTTWNLYALLVGNRNKFNQAVGHFWLLLYDFKNDNYISINDTSDKIERVELTTDFAIEYALYVRDGESYTDRYPIKQQICHLAEISSKMNNFGRTDLDIINRQILKKIIISKLR